MPQTMSSEMPKEFGAAVTQKTAAHKTLKPAPKSAKYEHTDIFVEILDELGIEDFSHLFGSPEKTAAEINSASSDNHKFNMKSLKTPKMARESFERELKDSQLQLDEAMQQRVAELFEEAVAASVAVAVKLLEQRQQKELAEKLQSSRRLVEAACRARAQRDLVRTIKEFEVRNKSYLEEAVNQWKEANKVPLQEQAHVACANNVLTALGDILARYGYNVASPADSAYQALTEAQRTAAQLSERTSKLLEENQKLRDELSTSRRHGMVQAAARRVPLRARRAFMEAANKIITEDAKDHEIAEKLMRLARVSAPEQERAERRAARHAATLRKQENFGLVAENYVASPLASPLASPASAPESMDPEIRAYMKALSTAE